MSRLENVIKELKNELDNITLIELAKNKDNIQNELTEVLTTIQDFFMLINNKSRVLNIKERRKE